MDALQEMSDLVRWLPELAADSDLKEEHWNEAHSAANRLEALLGAASSRSGDERRETYLECQAEIEQHLDRLVEIKQQFPVAGIFASDQEE